MNKRKETIHFFLETEIFEKLILKQILYTIAEIENVDLTGDKQHGLKRT